MPVEYPVTPLGEIAHIEMGQSPDSATVRDGEGIGVPFLQGNAEFGSLYPSPRFTCLAPMKMCKAGDILISVRAPVGAINIADRDYCIGRGLAAVRVEGMTSRLAAHVISAAAPALRRVAQGTTFEAINKADLASLMVKAPTSTDRAPLSQFLDTLDTTIRQTEAIIEKLKQVKQGLLHDLLTRGIDANGELRPPQSEAPHLYKASPLGWIPVEWDADQIRHVSTLVTSGSRGWADHYAEAGALFLRSQNVRMGYLDLSDRQHVVPPSGAEGERTRLNAGDLLITITGNGVGNVASVNSNWTELAFVSQHVGLVRLVDPRLSQLAMHYLAPGAPGNQQLIDAQYGQSKPGLSLDGLRGLWIPIPSSEEQEQIIDRIMSAQNRIEIEGSYARQMRDLKSGLMDDLLTGRVRVTPLIPRGRSNG